MVFKLLKNTAIRNLVRPYYGRIIAVCLMTLVTSLLQVFMALLTSCVVDAALVPDGKLAFWGALLVIDILLLVLFFVIVSWVSGSTADKFSASLRSELLRAAAYSHDVRLQGFHSGQLLSRGIEDVATVCDGMVNVLPSMVGQVTRLVGAFAAVLLIAPDAALVLIGAAIVICTLTACVRPALRKRHRKVRQADETVMSTMQEDLRQLELIQSLDAQGKVLSRFDSCQKVSLTEKRNRRVLSVSINSLMNMGTLGGTGVLLLWGAVQVANDQLSYGTLTSLLYLLTLFRGPVLGISGLWTRLAAMDVAGERLADMLKVSDPVPSVPVETVKAVVFEDVTFCYPGEKNPVLENFSIRFPLEQWCCLTGISGKGKSTIFKLVLGLYEPQSGTVYLETAAGKIPCGENTRHLFAYVPQDYALFSGTIQENLQLISDAGPEERAEALSVAQASFVFELTAREQTQVKENNAGLSKGQLQRLAIARAILMKRPILMLDECTSALDAATETAVLKGLYDMGKQAILVTHRPEALTDLQGIASVSMEKKQLS